MKVAARLLSPHPQLSVVWDVTATWSIQLGAFSTVGQEAWRERGAVVAIWRRF